MLGLSVDSAAVQKAYAASLGGIPYPILADFHPKGQVVQTYDIWNEERGNSRRSVIIVDKEGIIRFKEVYPPGTLPDPDKILAEVDKLG